MGQMGMGMMGGMPQMGGMGMMGGMPQMGGMGMMGGMPQMGGMGMPQMGMGQMGMGMSQMGMPQMGMPQMGMPQMGMQQQMPQLNFGKPPVIQNSQQQSFKPVKLPSGYSNPYEPFKSAPQPQQQQATYSATQPQGTEVKKLAAAYSPIQGYGQQVAQQAASQAAPQAQAGPAPGAPLLPGMAPAGITMPGPGFGFGFGPGFLGMGGFGGGMGGFAGLGIGGGLGGLGISSTFQSGVG